MSTKMHDVIVIGGGPAGSTAAALLAKDGHDVLLLEKEKFPREHVGESLLPFCYSLFEKLGVVDEMKKRFVRKAGVRFIDRSGKASTSWCFNHVIKDGSYLSFQVLRSEFDLLLLKNSIRLGAVVREQVKVTEFDFSDSKRVVVKSVDEGGKEETHHARFLIDASGRDAIIGSKMGWRKQREELDRTALWSHWDGVKLAGGLEEGLSLILYLGEEKKGWIWVFPLGPDRVTAGVVMQNSYMRDQRRKFQEAGVTDWKLALCEQEFAMSSFVKSLLENTRRIMPIMTNGDYSYEVQNHYGRNYAMIGDARGFIDPIFSSGIFLSIKTAFLVSAAVHQQLTTPMEGENPALVESYRMVTGAYNFVHRMIRLFYNPHAITWAEVGHEGQAHKRHESALAAGHYMLSGDFFESYEKYSRFLELLEDQKGFERYKRVIIDRTEYNELSCQVTFDQIFSDMLSMDAERRKANENVVVT